MWHLTANYNSSGYYICSTFDHSHMQNLQQLYRHFFPKANFCSSDWPLNKMELQKCKSCLDFVKDYKASNFLNETLGL